MQCTANSVLLIINTFTTYALALNKKMEEPLVTTKQGTLRGSVQYDVDNSSYYSFKGIPYAKPPVGELRFKVPLPADKWNGTLDATQEGNSCYSKDQYNGHHTGSSVMVWVHGGGFIYGSSITAFYGPGFLMTQDVVLVSFNYRIGMLGFLRLENSSLGVFGNMGLKDMVLALKWVKKNVEHFGGDPSNVTIFGESAGAVAVHLLLLSPTTRGLFHKAIAQSSSSLNAWAVTPGCPLQSLAEAAGKPELEAETLLKHLMGLPVEQILEIQEKIKDDLFAATARPFVPVIENVQNAAFLAGEPIDIVKKGTFNQVPFMTGFTTSEGLLFRHVRNVYEDMKQDFQLQIPFNLGYEFGSNDSKALAAKIKTFYYDHETPTKENVDKYIQLLSDTGFLYGIIKATEEQVLTSSCSLYVYSMSIETGLNFFKVIDHMAGEGVSHADDLGYLFVTFATPKFERGSAEDIGMRRFIKLWTNFAIYGNPTPDPRDPLLNVTWRPTKTGEKITYLDIGTKLTMASDPFPRRMAFWNEIHANSPHNTKLYSAARNKV